MVLSWSVVGNIGNDENGVPFNVEMDPLHVPEKAKVAFYTTGTGSIQNIVCVRPSMHVIDPMLVCFVDD